TATGGTSVTVNNVAPSAVVLNTGAIDEGDSFTLAGSFTDPGTQDKHTVVISWGPGEGTTTLTLPAGVTTLSAAHQYLDYNPSGTASDADPVSVPARRASALTASGATSVTVNNVAPSAIVLNAGAINESDTFTLAGSFADPGTLDTHTVVISWGPGEGTTTLT